MKIKRTHTEQGETQLGLLIGALVLGTLIAVISTMQSCFFEHKQYKVERRMEQWNEKHKRLIPVSRGKKGYSVQY